MNGWHFLFWTHLKAMYKDSVSLTVVTSLTSQNKCVNAMFLSEEKLNM